jgi:hypothetical protein
MFIVAGLSHGEKLCQARDNRAAKPRGGYRALAAKASPLRMGFNPPVETKTA